MLKSSVGDRHAAKEIEQLYRTLVSKKPLTLARFTKKFT